MQQYPPTLFSWIETKHLTLQHSEEKLKLKMKTDIPLLKYHPLSLVKEFLLGHLLIHGNGILQY